MAPTLVTSYLVVQSASNLTALVTPSFTPADGEVIVVKAVTATQACLIGTPTGGSLTYTSRGSIVTANYTVAALHTAVVGTSPGAMTVSQSFSGSSAWHSMVVERWSSATLAATPATVVTTQAAATAPSATVTTVAANSVVAWLIGDWNATAPTSRAYRSSATEEAIHDGSTTQYVAYYAYQAAATAGAQTIGMTAPTQTPAIIGIEVQAAGGGAVTVVNLWPTMGDAVRRRLLRG